MKPRGQIGAPYTFAQRQDRRSWAVHAADGALVALVLYRVGAEEVCRRLNAPQARRAHKVDE